MSIPEDFYKILIHTTRMEKYQATRVPKRLAQPEISAVNIYESSSMPSVKAMDTDELSSAALHLTPEEEINKLGESAKVDNSRSW